jgi:tetratricopeptide (TPR) repeat protein
LTDGGVRLAASCRGGNVGRFLDMPNARRILGALTVALLPQTVVAQQSPALAAMVARGDSAWTAERHDAAFVAYDSVVRADSAFSSRAVYRLGTLRSWRNELREAIQLHQLYVRLEPRDLEGRVGLARVYAWASRFDASIATYDTVLAREADYRDAAFGRATALAWSGKLAESIAAYDAWLRTHPTDSEAELGRARVLSWAGRLDEALAVYEKVAKTGNAAEAEKGIARVTGWRGDLEGSERLWRAAAAKYPRDPETWVGLGQVLRWMGRPFAARDALEKALEIKPSYDDARSQLQWVRAEIGQSAAPSFVHTTDSEHNDGNAFSVSADAAVGTNARVGARGAWKSNSAPAGTGTSIALRGAGEWQPGDGSMSVRGDLGFASMSARRGTAPERSYTTVVGGLRGRARLFERLRLGLGYSRDAFDDVVSTMTEGLSIGTLDGDVSVSLPSRVTLSAFAASSQASGDTIASNSRASWGANARWMPRRDVALMANMRTLSWDHPAYGTYFAPQRFTLMELAARWERPVDLGWLAAAEFGFGSQSIRFESDPAAKRSVPRGSVSFGWRPEPGREIMVTWLFANVASAATLATSDYSYRALTITGRLTR